MSKFFTLKYAREISPRFPAEQLLFPPLVFPIMLQTLFLGVLEACKKQEFPEKCDHLASLVLTCFFVFSLYLDERNSELEV